MRSSLCKALENRSNQQNMIFFTGDLGFMALEPLQEKLGVRFINAGVAEQNMISVSAAFAKDGWESWVYSIAPFLYARCFEQIRNDITFHNLPVNLIGNGGGYGYGVMGPTHHSIEDYGVLSTLSNIHIFIPAFATDLLDVVRLAGNSKLATYLRLGRSEWNKTPIAYSPWRQLIEGKNGVLVVVGPLAGHYYEKLQSLDVSERPNLWVVTELPISLNPPPGQIIEQIHAVNKLWVAEEHVEHGSFGQSFIMYLVKNKIPINHFKHFYAHQHAYDRYGSQLYLRQQSKLDVESILLEIKRQ
jgi:transketolase